MTISDRIRKYKSINMGIVVNDAARRMQDEIIQMNQSQMYNKGVMDVTRPASKLKYARSTIRQKRKKARFKKVTFITLRWSGDFYESMKLIFFKDRFVITADDLKWVNFLETQKRFSRALGLTDNSVTKFRDMVKPYIIERLRNV